MGNSFSPQVRYTAPSTNGNWSVSLENPETTLTPYGGGPRIDAEYIWGRREDESGDNGTLNRLQFSAKYVY